MLIAEKINLCKGNFMPCIFYINTIKSIHTNITNVLNIQYSMILLKSTPS